MSYTQQEIKSNILKSYSNGEDVLEKGGAGSRGGKIVGHTKSGKAIYDTHNHTSHKKFESADHKDAAKYHKGVAEKSILHFGKETTHSKEHEAAAKEHESMASKKSSNTENGSFRGRNAEVGLDSTAMRGGALPKTQSGMSINESLYGDHKDYRNFSFQDHKDAAKFFEKEASEWDQEPFYDSYRKKSKAKGDSHKLMGDKKAFLNSFYNEKGMSDPQHKKWVDKSVEKFGTDITGYEK